MFVVVLTFVAGADISMPTSPKSKPTPKSDPIDAQRVRYASPSKMTEPLIGNFTVLNAYNSVKNQLKQVHNYDLVIDIKEAEGGFQG